MKKSTATKKSPAKKAPAKKAPAKKVLTPRSEYGFDAMRKGEVKKIAIPEDKKIISVRARCAAYAYARRNGESFVTQTVTERGKTFLLIEMQ